MTSPAAIDKLAWLHVVERRLLVVRSRGRERWYLPGGKRDPGESDAAALVREIAEELTVALVPATIAHAATFVAPADGKPPGTLVQLTCYRAAYTGTLAPAAEIAALGWIDSREADACSAGLRIALDWLRERDLVA